MSRGYRQRSGLAVAGMIAGGMMVAGSCSGLVTEPKSASSPSATSALRQPAATATAPTSTPTPTPSPKATLPTGGRLIFPEHRLVGFSGGRSPAFGRLDIDDIPGAIEDLDELVPAYELDGRTVLPVFELITVVAHDSPTDSRLYRTVEPDHVIETYLDAARQHGALLLLNVQPGRADFLDEVKRLEPWLREPDVGLALDPEWAVDSGEVPGRTYGSTTGAELDGVAQWLSRLVKEHDLPEKVLVFHQVHPSVVEDESDLEPHPGVALIKSVDGIGAQSEKEQTWRRLMSTKPPWVHSGFKLFFEEDTRRGPLMTPEQVLALEPLPVYVLYE